MTSEQIMTQAVTEAAIEATNAAVIPVRETERSVPTLTQLNF